MNSKSSILPPTPSDKDSQLHWTKSVKLASMLYRWKLASSYESIFRLVRIHQWYLSQEAFKPDNTFIQQLIEQLPAVDGPRIWACYHIGPYALMARAIIQRGHGIAILLKDEVLEEQYPMYMQHFKRSFGREPNAKELQFVPASGPKAIIKLKQLLRSGYHIICYVDGEEGGNGEKAWTGIKLHNTTLNVRMGAAILSHLNGVPIRPVVFTTKGKKLILRSRGDLQVDSRQQYPTAMQYCYSLLEELSPEEILCWEYIPKIFDRTKANKRGLTGAPVWLPVYAKEKKLLFDIVSCNYAEVSEEQFEKLDTLRRKFLDYR